MTVNYDMDDPAIRHMIEMRHTPTEVVIRRADAVAAVVRIECECCGGDWPCHPITLLRVRRDDRVAK